MSPQAEQADTIEKRIERIESLIRVVLAKAEAHPVGRKILAYLGLS
jgi:hypothetical protein